MTIQKIVDPAHIESELLNIWDQLAKENKTRACLFNLIVFSSESPRTDYLRTIVQKVAEKFPCRTLFISSDPNSKHTYLKTAVSVISSASIACDQIDIGVAGSEETQVPFLLLPHLVPDLPIYLLWGEDPSVPHPLFDPLCKLATRLIFDSESTDHLPRFAKSLLNFNNKEIADLNWARTEGWRDLLISLLETSDLTQAKTFQITHNSHNTPFFCHNQIQSLYVKTWLKTRLHWNLEPKIISEDWEKLGTGNLIAIRFETKNGLCVDARRIPEELHQVQIQKNDAVKCDLPYQFMLGRAATGQSLVKEVTAHGTSLHYLDVLKELQ